MHYSKLLLPLSLCCAILGGCNKNDGENQNLNPGNQQSFDFMPVKTGSTWTYGVRDGVTYTRYARGKDSVVLGTTYAYYERKDENAGSYQPEYFGRNGTAYLTLIDLDGDESHYINYIFYKDGATVGASWENTGKIASPIGEVVVRISSSVAEDNLTMTINNKTYKKVVHVHSELSGGALSIPVGSIDGWMVKGIGVIREEANIDILGQYKQQHTDSLIDYNLVP